MKHKSAYPPLFYFWWIEYTSYIVSSALILMDASISHV